MAFRLTLLKALVASSDARKGKERLSPPLPNAVSTPAPIPSAPVPSSSAPSDSDLLTAVPSPSAPTLSDCAPFSLAVAPSTPAPSAIAPSVISAPPAPAAVSTAPSAPAPRRLPVPKVRVLVARGIVYSHNTLPKVRCHKAFVNQAITALGDRKDSVLRCFR
ncbi:hypothetical protein IAT38_004423 [Cryptococcus sp. DSM 104549]